jgi:DNA replication protein DnaC
VDEKDSGSSHPAPGIGQYGSVFPGCGKTHLALALGVEAVKSGRSVYFATLADIVSSLAKAEREGTLRERLRFLCRPQLLIID